jgi:hypothetical protein
MIRRVIADMAERGLQPDAKETELLHVAGGLADQLVALRLDVKKNGTSTKLSSGRVVLNPAVAAITSTSAELSKVLGQIQMDLGQPKDAAKQKAAQARWAAHNQAKARMQGGA